MRSTVLLMLLCATVHAQVEDEPVPGEPMPGAPVVAAVPDVAFRAVGDRPVVVVTRGGQLTARILLVDPVNVTVAVLPTQTVTVLRRAEIVELRLAEVSIAAPPVAIAAPVEPPAKKRHFGLHLGLPPALDLDLDYNLFYGFMNVSLVFPAATAGQWFAFATGLGVNFPLAKNSGWKMEAFVQFTSLEFERVWSLGLGVGIGFHYTFRSGFNVGFKVPVLGYSFALNRSYNSVGENVAIYYLSTAMGSPLLNVGYRF